MLVTTENKPSNNQVSFDVRSKQLEQEAAEADKIAAERKKSPYSNWIQLNADQIDNLRALVKTPAAADIFLFLIKNMDKTNAIVCSYAVLMEALNLSKATVTRSIKTLKDMKFVEVYKTGSTNVYAINANIVWKSYGSNAKYARFSANVILSSTEQETPVKTSRQTVVEIKKS